MKILFDQRRNSFGEFGTSLCTLSVLIEGDTNHYVRFSYPDWICGLHFCYKVELF